MRTIRTAPARVEVCGAGLVIKSRLLAVQSFGGIRATAERVDSTPRVQVNERCANGLNGMRFAANRHIIQGADCRRFQLSPILPESESGAGARPESHGIQGLHP